MRLINPNTSLDIRLQDHNPSRQQTKSNITPPKNPRTQEPKHNCSLSLPILTSWLAPHLLPNLPSSFHGSLGQSFAPSGADWSGVAVLPCHVHIHIHIYRLSISTEVGGLDVGRWRLDVGDWRLEVGGGRYVMQDARFEMQDLGFKEREAGGGT